MFGRVNVLVYENPEALVIPPSGFTIKEGQYFVYVIHLDNPDQAIGTAEMRPIRVGRSTADGIEVEEGLIEGELIAVDLLQDAIQELQDQMKVEITEIQESLL